MLATENEATGVNSFISDIDELLAESEVLLGSLSETLVPATAAASAAVLPGAGSADESVTSGDSSSGCPESPGRRSSAGIQPANKKRSRNSTRDREKSERELFRKQVAELEQELVALQNGEKKRSSALAPAWRRLADRQLQGRQKAESENKYLKAMVEENARVLKRLWEIMCERSRKSPMPIHSSALRNEQERNIRWEDSVVFERLKGELAEVYARTDDVVRESGVGRMLDEGIECSHSRTLHYSENALQTRCGELIETRLIPFDAHVASNATWDAATVQYMRSSLYGMQQTDEAFLSVVHQEGGQHNDIFVVKLQVKLRLNGVDVIFDARGAMRWYKEEGRHVYIWRMGYNSSKRNSAAAADMTDTGWMVLKKTPSSCTSSIMGTVVHSEVSAVAGYEDEHNSNILANSLMASNEDCMDELNMLVENMLLEASVATDGRSS